MRRLLLNSEDSWEAEVFIYENMTLIKGMAAELERENAVDTEPLRLRRRGRRQRLSAARLTLEWSQHAGMDIPPIAMARGVIAVEFTGSYGTHNIGRESTPGGFYWVCFQHIWERDHITLESPTDHIASGSRAEEYFPLEKKRL